MLERYRRDPPPKVDATITTDVSPEEKTERQQPLWRKLLKKLLIFFIRLAIAVAIVLLANWAYNK